MRVTGSFQRWKTKFETQYWKFKVKLLRGKILIGSGHKEKIFLKMRRRGFFVSRSSREEKRRVGRWETKGGDKEKCRVVCERKSTKIQAWARGGGENGKKKF